MEQMKKRLWTLVLACLMAFSAAVPSYAAQGGGEVVQPMLTEPAKTNSKCGMSDAQMLTIKNEYTAQVDTVNRVLITTYVEKRKLLGSWERVDIGQLDNEWRDYCYGQSNSKSHSVQLPSSGTYRVTAVFEIYHNSTLLDTVTQTSTVTC